LTFDTRVVTRWEQPPTVLLICGVRSRNIIDATCDVLLAAGMPILGRYVTVRDPPVDPRLEPRLRLVGQAVRLDGNQLLLQDHGDGPSTVDIRQAYLEPRRENVLWCLKNLIPQDAERAMSVADAEALKQTSGAGRLATIRSMFGFLKKKPIEVVPGIPLVFGDLAGSSTTAWGLQTRKIEKPLLVFDPSGTRTNKWNQGGLDKHGPYDQRTFSPKQLRIAVVCQAIYEGQVDLFLGKFLDGMPNVKVRSGNGETAPYEKGFIRRYALEAAKVKTFVAQDDSADSYADACRRAIQSATDQGYEWDLALVQIDKDFRELAGANNPYFATKAVFLKHRVPVQQITLETIRFADKQLVYALNNMSVATYAKVGGIPWLLKSEPIVAHELVIGLGSHTVRTSRLGAGERIVGITTMFTSDGKYLLDDRTEAVPYDQYADTLYQSLSRSIADVRKVDNWRSSDSVRLIFHVFKQFADHEVAAVAKLIETIGVADIKFAFVHLVDDHPFSLFDESSMGVGYNDRVKKGELVPERGVSVPLSDTETLMCFVGPKEIKDATHGMPRPALLRLHRKSSFRDMGYLTRQAFDFSCHSWRMFSPAPLPITIHYSELIAQLLMGLREVPSWDPDVMIGPVSRTRWFL
jgi:hypothetical protein